MDTPPPAQPDDDQLAEMLAERLIDLASRPGPHRLRILQAVGLAPQPGCITQQRLGQEFGCSATRIGEIERQALRKLRHRSKHLKP